LGTGIFSRLESSRRRRASGYKQIVTEEQRIRYRETNRLRDKHIRECLKNRKLGIQESKNVEMSKVELFARIRELFGIVKP